MVVNIYFFHPQKLKPKKQNLLSRKPLKVMLGENSELKVTAYKQR